MADKDYYRKLGKVVAASQPNEKIPDAIPPGALPASRGNNEEMLDALPPDALSADSDILDALSADSDILDALPADTDYARILAQLQNAGFLLKDKRPGESSSVLPTPPGDQFQPYSLGQHAARNSQPTQKAATYPGCRSSHRRKLKAKKHGKK